MTTLLAFLLHTTELSQASQSSVKQTSFGKTSDGKSVSLFTCTNKKGNVLKLTDFGARIVEFSIPDHKGNRANVTLGLNNALAYEKHDAHFGGIAGRFANRIASGRFTLDKKEYTLVANNGPNHLHGGLKGFDSVVWRSKPIKQKNGVGVQFDYLSQDGDEGYPGNLQATATYIFTDDNELRIELTAKTDKPTVINLTNHAYWNLSGVGTGDVLKHELTLAAKHFLPIDKTSIPTGEIKPVKNSAMDFTTPQLIGARINELKQDPHVTKGYDHCYILDNQNGKLAFAARLKDPESRRVMEVWTTQPGIQLYVGNFLDGGPTNGGFKQHSGVCLETQHYPDSPNRPEFPTTVLRPGETYKQTTVHKFFVE